MSAAQDVLKYLQQQTSPVKGAAIAVALGLKDDEEVRGCVNHLRRTGELICANSHGYWVTENETEAERYLEDFEGRVRSQNEAIKGMRDRLNMKKANARYDARGQGRFL